MKIFTVGQKYNHTHTLNITANQFGAKNITKKYIVRAWVWFCKNLLNNFYIWGQMLFRKGGGLLRNCSLVSAWGTLAKAECVWRELWAGPELGTLMNEVYGWFLEKFLPTLGIALTEHVPYAEWVWILEVGGKLTYRSLGKWWLMQESIW